MPPQKINDKNFYVGYNGHTLHLKKPYFLAGRANISNNSSQDDHKLLQIEGKLKHILVSFNKNLNFMFMQKDKIMNIKRINK